MRTAAVAALVCGLAFSYWQWCVIAPVRLPQQVGRWNRDLSAATALLLAGGWLLGRRRAARPPS